MENKMNEYIKFDIKKFDNCTFDELKSFVIDLYKITSTHHQIISQLVDSVNTLASNYNGLSDDTTAIMTIVESLVERAVKGGKGPLKIAPIKGLK